MGFPPERECAETGISGLYLKPEMPITPATSHAYFGHRDGQKNCPAAIRSSTAGLINTQTFNRRKELPMAMPSFSMRQLMEAGVHFGHHTRRWNPKMSAYLFGIRNNIHI